MAFAPEIVNSAQTGRASLATQAVPLCLLCSTRGEPLYSGLEDRLFNAPGIWKLNKCTNVACGLAWLDPMPIEKDVSKAYDTYYTHSSKEIEQVPSLKRVIVRNTIRLFNLVTLPLGLRRERYRRSMMYLETQVPRKLLEIGCGNGSFLDRMRAKGWDVQGVEVDGKAAKVASNVFGLRVFIGTLHQAAFPDDYFDAITLSHVIEHVHDPISLLKECRRVLRPRGCVVIITPNIESLGHAWFGNNWLHLDPPRHLQIFSRRTISMAADKAGLKGFDTWTTPVNAEGSYMGSTEIRMRGRHRFGDEAASFPLAIKAICFEIWALLYWRRFPSSGEEVVLRVLNDE